jgi:hypothetical protein
LEEHMNTEFARLVNDAAQIEACGRWDSTKARIKFLARNLGSDNSWWVQLFGGLCCHTYCEYLALKRTYENNRNGDAALLAWRARNLLELSVWATYCARSRESARSLYQRALSDGIESFERPYERVSAAAVECGIVEQFTLSYKTLSKFAHPTAMQIVATPDDAREALQKDVFYGEGCLFFCGAFNVLERQLAQSCDSVGRAIKRDAEACDDEQEVTVYG